MTIKDGWHTLEPHMVYVPEYKDMTREEIDAMIERETRIFNAVDDIRKKARERVRRAKKKTERTKGK
jgi:hypothetical protein